MPPLGYWTQRGAAIAALAIALATVSARAEGPPNVMQAQRLLKDLGYEVGVVDGKAGARMRAAIKAFQRDRGLPVTGELDAGTSVALRPPPARLELTAASPEKSLPRTVIDPAPDLKVKPSGDLPTAVSPPASDGGWIWIGAILAGVWWWRWRKRRTTNLHRAKVSGQEQRTTSVADAEYRQEVDASTVACAASASPTSSPEVSRMPSAPPPEIREVQVRPDVCGRTSSCSNLGGKHCPLSQGVGKRDCAAYVPLESPNQAGCATTMPPDEITALPSLFSPTNALRQGAELSLGEINRRKVAEILARRQTGGNVDTGARTAIASPSAEIRSLGPLSTLKPDTTKVESPAPAQQTARAQPDQPATPSPGEINRQRVAEILARREASEGNDTAVQMPLNTLLHNNAAGITPRLHQAPSHSYYKGTSGRPGCGRTADCGNYQKPTCLLTGGATQHIDYCQSFCSRTVSYGYRAFVAGHWRHNKNGKMTWVKPHSRRW
jgi:peptidoglycan hydrolase-like protein with peptidoglycan-binding domain